MWQTATDGLIACEPTPHTAHQHTALSYNLEEAHMYRKVVACPNLVGRVPDTRLLAQFLCTTKIDVGMGCKGVAHNNSKYSKANPVRLV